MCFFQRLVAAAVVATTGTTGAFVVTPSFRSVVTKNVVALSSSTAAAGFEGGTGHVSARVATTKEAPGAGYLPRWEGRHGLPKKEFMYSDASKPDRSGMWECPLCLKDSEGIDVAEAQRQARQVARKTPLEIRATAFDNNKGVRYFQDERENIRELLREHGSIWFRGFNLMQSVDGYRSFYEALQFEPCLDPLHSLGVRNFASERDAIYEELNKPSIRRHYIGLHYEKSPKRGAAYAAFVCFQPATGGGGRFLVADGAAILADLDPKLLQKMYDRQLRTSVSNLDIPPQLPTVVKEGIKSMVSTMVGNKFDVDMEMIYESDGTPGRLQAVEEAESPINRHPVTGIPVWFSHAHNHARKLRLGRSCEVPEVGMTDIFYADTMEPLSFEDCQEIKRASEKNIAALAMEPGDVLLVDNYRTLHGRDVFEGDRFHAVSWFTWDDNEVWRGEECRPLLKNALNVAMNKYLYWLPKKDSVGNQDK